MIVLTTLKLSCIHFWTSKILKHHNPPMSDESLNIWGRELWLNTEQRVPQLWPLLPLIHTTNCGGHRPPKKLLNWHELKMLMLKTTIGHSIHIKNRTFDSHQKHSIGTVWSASHHVKLIPCIFGDIVVMALAEGQPSFRRIPHYFW